MALPGMTEKLIVCNLPNLRGMNRELANNVSDHQETYLFELQPRQSDFR